MLMYEVIKRRHPRRTFIGHGRSHTRRWLHRCRLMLSGLPKFQGVLRGLCSLEAGNLNSCAERIFVGVSEYKSPIIKTRVDG